MPAHAAFQIIAFDCARARNRRLLLSREAEPERGDLNRQVFRDDLCSVLTREHLRNRFGKSLIVFSRA